MKWNVKRLVVGLIAGLALAGFLVAPASALDEGVYTVTVMRDDQDEYSVWKAGMPLGVLIKTQWCYELAFSESAYLVWDGDYSWNNKLLFIRDPQAFLIGNETARRCDVTGVYAKVAPGGY